MKPGYKKDRWLASMVSKMDNAKADEMDDKVDDEMHLYDMIRNMSNNNMFNNNGEPVNDPFSQVRFRKQIIFILIVYYNSIIIITILL